jgi:hypothetical protein
MQSRRMSGNGPRLKTGPHLPIHPVKPMNVHNPHSVGTDAAQNHASARRTEAETAGTGVSFAEQLASASKKKSGKTDSAAAPKEPAGEKTAAVPGHSDYRDIVAGPRDGMFLNTSGNKRNGEAFVLVKRHGIEYHIYGTGKHRQVIELKPHKHKATAPPVAVAPTTTTPSTSGTTDTSSTSTSSATQSTPSA